MTLGYRTTNIYDAIGQKIATQNALGYLSTRVFDAIGRTMATVNPLGYMNTNIYDVGSERIATGDVLPQVSRPAGGRPQILSDSELVTLLLWNGLTVQHHTLKVIWKWAQREQRSNFPIIPKYKGFVVHCHRILPVLVRLMESHCVKTCRLRLVESTMLPVCRECRADHHKVAQGLAAWGKNNQGWYFGWKLHAALAPDGSIASFRFTPANESDLLQLPELTIPDSIAVGDRGYTARVMRGKLWSEKRCLVVTPPRQKQDKQVMAFWQYQLLKLRQKAECAFDLLKQHLHLVTSFPRSARGYFLHYLRVMLTYQLQVQGF